VEEKGRRRKIIQIESDYARSNVADWPSNPPTRRRQNQKREKSNLRKVVIIDHAIAAACQS
jgi:hypothetical protein